MIQVPGSKGHQQVEHAVVDGRKLQLIARECLAQLPVDPGLEPPVVDQDRAVPAAALDQASMKSGRGSPDFVYRNALCCTSPPFFS